MAVIAVAGFHHETNTFAPSKAAYEDFVGGGGWPPLTRGLAAISVVEGINLGLAGFVTAARTAGHRLLPLVWANATPSAHVTRDAYERIVGALIEELGQGERFDAIFIDLHGAMVTEHLDDGEGELLARLRRLVGPRIPIVASLDYHANVTPAMIALADGLVGYRTYPHVDMAETGRRAAALLNRILNEGRAPTKAFRQLSFLIPLTAQCTMIEPSVGLFRRLAELEVQQDTTLTFAGGFPAADIADCGPSVFGYGFDPERVGQAVDALASEIEEAEGAFQAEFLTPDDGVRRAMARSEPGGPPVVLADTQDNPGAGGNGDTVGVLEAMLRQKADGVVGLLIDPASAKRAHDAGRGAELDFALGAVSGVPGHVPCTGRFRVAQLGDGNFVGTGPFYSGARMRLGPMAALTRDKVTVVVASKKVQAADQEMFRCVGIEPARQRVMALKSSVHFRAHFQPIAREILVVAAPGPMPADPAVLPWTKLRRGVRLRPRGPEFGGPAIPG
ncbi:MAG: M81 family metallopeptidase [Alphaproteobacteria bacterium]|nr:M81 family metallopeptidase [Alphaproteobacteria bacterium]